ncbi:MAG: UDP-glucose/GDP-mannose dehydrogenase family protein, partial [Nanoarchaeota archaeon]|nr:UDP-glucose/GDP-mannose dehydrogenase family protein [Nanoarchaeota archaeon]
ADRGNKVICVDKNPNVVDLLNNGKIHIYEPGLEELVEKNTKEGRLKFTGDIISAVENSDIIFLGVNTPSDKDGSFNLEYLFQAAKDVGKALQKASGYKIVVGKSTVPQGTFKLITEIINSEIGNNPNLKWDYVSNPETLAEGTAVRDFAKPDRIIIGTKSDRAFEVMEDLYHPFNITNDRVIRGSPTDAELAKLMSNTALATRVAMVNEFARIADVTEDADMNTIRIMVCEDQRIGYKFMFPSPGYGGSCFPKDIQGIVEQSKKDGYNPLLLNSIHKSNELHKEYLGKRIAKILSKIKNPKIGILGITFKPNTDDMRDAASVPIINKLLDIGAKISVYDPKDEKAREIFANKIQFMDNQNDVAKDADALILMTEWKIFDSQDFEKLKSDMKGNYIFDLRNRWLANKVNEKGFNYYGVGRNYELKK